MMRRWITAILSGRDNKTPDIVRVLGALMGIQFIVSAGWALVVAGQTWDPNSYGLGAASLLAAIGVSLGLKRKDEPSSE